MGLGTNWQGASASIARAEKVKAYGSSQKYAVHALPLLLRVECKRMSLVAFLPAELYYIQRFNSLHLPYSHLCPCFFMIYGDLFPLFAVYFLNK